MTFNKQKLIKDLEEILNESLDSSYFPYQKGNSIRIGKYAVRTNKKGFYSVFNCETNAYIAETFSKTAAVALARSLSKGKNNTNEIIKLDKEVQKWYNDCVFYKHTISVTKDCTKRDVTLTRYDIAKSHTKYVKSQLDRFVFN